MEVIAPVEETVANTVPYVAAPVVPTAYTHQAPVLYAPYAYGYAPHQGYYQAPVAPVVPTAYTHQAPVPYAPYAYGYAPHQEYYQAPVAPVVQHTPVHAPVSYYAPTHAYYQAAVPVSAPEATVV